MQTNNIENNANIFQPILLIDHIIPIPAYDAEFFQIVAVQENAIISTDDPSCCNKPDKIDCSQIIQEGEKTKRKPRTKSLIDNFHYTMKEYKNKESLQKVPLVSLKKLAKSLKLKITAKKNIIIERIEEYFYRAFRAVLIQKIFRGYLVRMYFRLRGPAFKHRDTCVNVNDGYTLEPIHEIPFERFYSLVDSKNYTYGFDVVYLLIEMKTKYNPINIFSRENIPVQDVKNIIHLEHLIRIISPSVIEREEYEKLNRRYMVNTFVSSTVPIPPNVTIRNRHIHFDEETNLQLPPTPPQQNRGENPTRQDTLYILEQQLREIREKSVEQRVQDLFIEIDLLGNYTSSVWFSSINNYMVFFRHLSGIWNNRLRLSIEERRKICQIGDPFMHVGTVVLNRTNEEMKEICLTVMENLIYGGVDIEYRKLGAYRVIMAFTIVNINARNSYYWLYESIA